MVVRFASNETEVRALVESQMIAKRLHAEKMGFKLSPESRILVTGGASVNTTIQQVNITRWITFFSYFFLGYC